MGSLVSRDELRRLEKAARDKDKRKLYTWLQQYSHYLEDLLRKEYNTAYQDEVASSVQNAIIAIAYTAYFSEENYVNKENIADYMADLFTTIDMFRTGEYKPEDYSKALKDVGVTIEPYDYDGPYKNFIKNMDNDLVNYLRGAHRKIVTICGSSKYKDEILQAYEDLTFQNYIVLMDGVFNQSDEGKVLSEEKKQLDNLHKDKILISDAIYVVNKDGYIGDSTKSEIEYAKAHNKEVMYLEEIE